MRLSWNLASKGVSLVKSEGLEQATGRALLIYKNEEMSLARETATRSKDRPAGYQQVCLWPKFPSRTWDDLSPADGLLYGCAKGSQQQTGMVVSRSPTRQGGSRRLKLKLNTTRLELHLCAPGGAYHTCLAGEATGLSEVPVQTDRLTKPARPLGSRCPGRVGAAFLLVREGPEGHRGRQRETDGRRGREDTRRERNLSRRGQANALGDPARGSWRPGDQGTRGTRGFEIVPSLSRLLLVYAFSFSLLSGLIFKFVGAKGQRLGQPGALAMASPGDIHMRKARWPVGLSNYRE